MPGQGQDNKRIDEAIRGGVGVERERERMVWRVNRDRKDKTGYIQMGCETYRRMEEKGRDLST